MTFLSITGINFGEFLNARIGIYSTLGCCNSELVNGNLSRALLCQYNGRKESKINKLRQIIGVVWKINQYSSTAFESAILRNLSVLRLCIYVYIVK